MLRSKIGAVDLGESDGEGADEEAGSNSDPILNVFFIDYLIFSKEQGFIFFLSYSHNRIKCDEASIAACPDPSYVAATAKGNQE